MKCPAFYKLASAQRARRCLGSLWFEQNGSATHLAFFLCPRWIRYQSSERAMICNSTLSCKAVSTLPHAPCGHDHRPCSTTPTPSLQLIRITILRSNFSWQYVACEEQLYYYLSQKNWAHNFMNNIVDYIEMLRVFYVGSWYKQRTEKNYKIK